jgi:LysR family transcriptional regulator, transcriptional activator for dmlA
MKTGLQAADLAFLVTIASSASLTAAARELGVSTAAASKKLSLIETRAGLALVTRSTRRMSLTPEGEMVIARAKLILGQMAELDQLLLHATHQPHGLLRVNATLGFGRSRIAPLLSEYAQTYPHVEIQLQLSVNPPPISDDSFDVCFRFGKPPDSRVIARFIAPNQRILVASPSYLKQFGEPKIPSDLNRHRCIGIRQGDEAYGVWRFNQTGPQGKSARTHTQASDERIKVRGNLTTNDGEIAVNWALEGHGILQRAEWDVARFVQSGRLVQVLANYRTPDADLYAVYSPQHQTSLRVKALIDLALVNFAKPPTAD